MQEEEKESPAVEAEEKGVKGGGGKERGDVAIAGICNDVRANVKKNDN